MAKPATRINLAGPLALNGLVNRANTVFMRASLYLTMGKDYLTVIFDKWESLQDCRNIPIILKGHSRGAVAAAEGAMMLKQWVAENYPQYLPYVKFELVQYDPVPGFGSRFGVNEEFDHSGHKEYEKSGDKMRALGEGAEPTVVCSLHTEHSSFFTPQAVKGAKRVILTPFKHGVGLDQIDQRPSVRGARPLPQGKATGPAIPAHNPERCIAVPGSASWARAFTLSMRAIHLSNFIISMRRGR